MIELKNVVKEFKKPIRAAGFFGMLKTLFSRKYSIIKAVNGISFTINDGESVGYIGANGSGKSTTIKMMSGILTPTSGEVLIDGLRPYKSRERNKILRNIGVVFGQKTQLWFDLPLNETFSLLKRIYDISDTDYNERLEFLTKTLELDKFMTSPVRTLSLGQRMRADLAAAMLHNPKVLFLDEPTIGLDVAVKRRLIEAIKLMRRRFNTTLILTTHAMSDIEDLCERIIIIDEGKPVYDGDLKHIKDKYGDKRKVIFGTLSEVDIEKIKADLGQGILDAELTEGGVKVFIDAAVLRVNVLLDYILKNFEVLDIKIEETDIEHIVEKIYETKQV